MNKLLKKNNKETLRTNKDIVKCKKFMVISVIIFIFLPYTFKVFWAWLLLLIPISYFGLRSHSLKLVKCHNGSEKTINGIITKKVLGIWTVYKSELVNINKIELKKNILYESVTYQVMLYDKRGAHQFGSILFTEARYKKVNNLFQMVSEQPTVNEIFYNEFPPIKRFSFSIIIILILLLFTMPILIILRIF